MAGRGPVERRVTAVLKVGNANQPGPRKRGPEVKSRHGGAPRGERVTPDAPAPLGADFGAPRGAPPPSPGSAREKTANDPGALAPRKRTRLPGDQIHAEQTPDDPFAFGRKLINVTRQWRACEARVCRRAQRCAVPKAPCVEKNSEEIRAWFRRVYIPYLRKRWPTVQWGAPAGLVEQQLEAAKAAEAAPSPVRGSRRKGRRRPKRRRRKPAAVPIGHATN
jgi:hypothetical protein